MMVSRDETVCVGWWGLAVVCALLLIASPGFAQKKPDKGAAEKAKEAFEKGMTHYVEQDYAKSIVDFKRAQQLYPSATLLYNIALARMRLGQTEEATETARRALNFEGDGKGLDDESRTKAQAILDGGSIFVKANRQVEGAAARRESAPPPGPEGAVDRRGRLLGALGWSGVATGIVGVGGIAGIPVMASRYNSQIDELEKLQTGPDKEDFQSTRAQAQTSRRIGQVLLYGAPTLTALGVGMIALDVFVFRGGRATTRMRMTPDGRWSVQMKW